MMETLPQSDDGYAAASQAICCAVSEDEHAPNDDGDAAASEDGPDAR